MNDRHTPETDALDCELHNPQVLQDRYSAILDHARKLERERDEARELAQQMLNQVLLADIRYYRTAWEQLKETAK